MASDRLRDGDDFAGRLLRAGLDDAPSIGAGARIAAGLALGTSVAGSAAASTTVSAAAASSAASGAGTGAMATSAVTTVSLVKTFAVSLVAGSVALGTASALSERAPSSFVADAPATETHTQSTPDDPRKAPMAAEPLAAPEPATIREEPPKPSPSERRSRSARVGASSAGAPTAVSPPEAPAPSVGAFTANNAETSATPSNDTAFSVAQEIAVLDGVRASLSSGRADHALDLLDRHQSNLKTLWVEAQVARVEALLRAGRHAEARALGERFVRTYANSAHAARVRQLLDQ